MLVLSALLAGGGLMPPPHAAPPPTTRYRIEQQIETLVDLSAFGQGEQVQPQALVWFATVAYADSAGGYGLTVVLDSLQADLGPSAMPQATIDSARGVTFRGRMEPAGRVTALVPDRPGTFAALFEAEFRGLHPVRKAATEAASWVDTLALATRTAQGETRVVTTSSYTHGGTAPRDATRIDATFTTVTTGTLMTMAGPADMLGAGTGTATYLVASDGRLLEALVRTTGEASLSGAFAPMAIPLKISSTTTVAVLP